MGDSSKLRLFVGAPIPDVHLRHVDGALEPLRAKLRKARWTQPENQHLTLKFLGWAPEDRLEGIRQVCAMVAAGRKEADVALTQLGAFPSKTRVRVLWIGVDDPNGILTELAQDLDRALEPLGFPTEARPYSAHLTLARFKLPVPLKSGFPEVDVSSLPPFPIADIRLYRSHLSSTGARYEVMDSFPLGPRP